MVAPSPLQVIQFAMAAFVLQSTSTWANTLIIGAVAERFDSAGARTRLIEQAIDQGMIHCGMHTNFPQIVQGVVIIYDQGEYVVHATLEAALGNDKVVARAMLPMQLRADCRCEKT